MSISSNDLRRMMNQVRANLTGATDDAIKGQLYNVIDEFFTDSNAWWEGINFNIVAFVQNYTITPSDGMIKRLGVIIDHYNVTYPSAVTELDPPSANVNLFFPQNTNIAVTAIVYKTIILPTDKESIPFAPKWLLPMYERAIESGTIGYMQMQGGKVWSNAQLGAINVRRFRDQIAMARTAAARGNLLGGQAWTYPNNFRTNSQRGGVSTVFPQPPSGGI